jgi:hypothetical protein
MILKVEINKDRLAFRKCPYSGSDVLKFSNITSKEATIIIIIMNDRVRLKSNIEQEVTNKLQDF